MGTDHEALMALLARTASDSQLRDRLTDNPRDVLSDELGMDVPEEVEIVVVCDSEDVVHLVLPRPLGETQIDTELSEDDLTQVSGGFQGIWGGGGFQGISGGGGLQFGG